MTGVPRLEMTGRYLEGVPVIYRHAHTCTDKLMKATSRVSSGHHSRSRKLYCTLSHSAFRISRCLGGVILCGRLTLNPKLSGQTHHCFSGDSLTSPKHIPFLAPSPCFSVLSPSTLLYEQGVGCGGDHCQ